MAAPASATSHPHAAARAADAAHQAAGPAAMHRLTPPWVDGVLDLLAGLRDSGEERFFHPHRFDRDTLEALCNGGPAPERRDEYWVAVSPDETVAAYGMLRGWSEGYAVPSLGIAVHSAWRGRGLARRMMQHLHAVARSRGAERVRLKAYPDNHTAIRLYESLGYVFAGDAAPELVGMLELHPDTGGLNQP